MADVVQRLNHALAGRYAIDHALGQTGMATVYLAHDPKHDRKVALKVLKPELAAVLGAERFVVEIRTTARLQHPHILPLFDSGTADGFLYYVMPYIKGETLREKLERETQLSVGEAVRITTEVADALDYAHTQAVIHRDIKPENILLANGRPMVADFGIALAVSAAAGGRMTETGLSLGTPHYMSPEQATAEKELTGRSDVYSLASVLYELLTGNPPHTGAAAQQIIMKIVTEEAAPVILLRKAVPPNVAAAVAKALEKLPADRFETARAFADALTNPAFALPGAARGVDERRHPGWRRYAAAIIAALGLVAVVTSVLAVLGRRSGAPAAVARLSLALPATEGLASTAGTRLAWAPDGQSFVYVGPGREGSQLWLRSLDALEAAPIRGTDGASSPFFSPDGTRIGFVNSIPFRSGRCRGPAARRCRSSGSTCRAAAPRGAPMTSSTSTDSRRFRGSGPKFPHGRSSTDGGARMIRRKTAALILIVACGPIASAQDPLNGQWIGGHLAEEGYVWVRMRVQTDSGGGRPAVVDVPFQLRNGQRSPIRLTDGRVRFDFAQRAGRTEVVAELRGDTIRGVATTAGPEREFRMTRVQPITGEMAGRLSGMYETGDHHLVAVGASGEWGSITTWTSRPA